MNEVLKKLCLLLETEKPYEIIFTAIKAGNKEAGKYEEKVTNLGVALFQLLNEVLEIKE